MSYVAPVKDMLFCMKELADLEAIALLDEEQRTLVVLRDVEGLSYEEIVEITELPEGTVKSRLHRAREKLVGILEKLQVAGGSKNRGE